MCNKGVISRTHPALLLHPRGCNKSGCNKGVIITGRDVYYFRKHCMGVGRGGGCLDIWTVVSSMYVYARRRESIDRSIDRSISGCDPWRASEDGMYGYTVTCHRPLASHTCVCVCVCVYI